MERAKIYRYTGWGSMALAVIMLLITGIWLRTHPSKIPINDLLAIRLGAFPRGIVIHHSATPPTLNGRPVDVAVLDAMHAERGFSITDKDGKVYHVGYHFVIQQDGTVLTARPETLPGAHTRNHNDMLGISLIGNFQASDNHHNSKGPVVPPPPQLAAAEKLTRELMAKYHLPLNTIYLHRDLNNTDCPGDMFPRAQFMQALR